VTLDKEKNIAKVSAPEDQLSMAIGKDGQNVRLTSKLTGWRIEVEGNGMETSPVVEEIVKNDPETSSGLKKITKTKAKKLAKKAKEVEVKKEEDPETSSGLEFPKVKSE
jgi:N utilization substance protein A